MKNQSVVKIHVKSDHQELLAKVARFVIETSPEEVPLEVFKEKFESACEATFRNHDLNSTE